MEADFGNQISPALPAAPMRKDRDPARGRLGAFHSEVAPSAAKTISISVEGSISPESSESPEGPSAMTLSGWECYGFAACGCSRRFSTREHAATSGG
ncbi:hypothetical protein OIDMADRAFT_59663 [Oidiodendron maius Zn]|uniref:Uncharacterized protein n=1 Tax=Oidiodendron maius (strain Zn) TaxID=913774 RepID=A0A0C3GVA4_OIDMZ|nr:hypothetical protein OIDMADRAFT_59663 [Oidiodendron maius Zn]